MKRLCPAIWFSAAFLFYSLTANAAPIEISDLKTTLNTDFCITYSEDARVRVRNQFLIRNPNSGPCLMVFQI